jgi:hypothetical protein
MTTEKCAKLHPAQRKEAAHGPWLGVGDVQTNGSFQLSSRLATALHRDALDGATILQRLAVSLEVLVNALSCCERRCNNQLTHDRHMISSG